MKLPYQHNQSCKVSNNFIFHNIIVFVDLENEVQELESKLEVSSHQLQILHNYKVSPSLINELIMSN